MNEKLYHDAQIIIAKTIAAVLPDETVKKYLNKLPTCKGKIYLVAIGKAAYQMALAAQEQIGEQINDGIIITKYGHSKQPIAKLRCFEAGHPIVDDNSCKASKAVWEMTNNLSKDDLVVFLLSGGGSALFEIPLIPLAQLQAINEQLLRCGASIEEINTIRKRLSQVKGGKFARHCAPAKVYTIILSDILHDPIDMIASGPSANDHTTSQEALDIVAKYQLAISQEALACLKMAAVNDLDNSEIVIGNGVASLAQAAKKATENLGYYSMILSDCIDGEAKSIGQMMANIARYQHLQPAKRAYIIAGESIVYVKGKGKGGRNQEMALSAASKIAGLDNVAFFCIGSDGTDGPTDAAGGYVDGDSYAKLLANNINVEQMLADNDAYNALARCAGLIKLGPTGTNVNDFAVLLIDEPKVN
ncbi:MAG: glycerate kinase [Erysipelotrichaceae bacterium]|nr:glycerate kinase [Erysipelotrichaceae bacterium]MDY5252057.1 glycerate kinase [Erysipelotrichaceae bacterium]